MLRRRGVVAGGDDVELGSTPIYSTHERVGGSELGLKQPQPA
jgi:hypothetical protein